MIYLSEDEGVLTTLAARYQTDIAPSGLRVKHYRDHLFLSASCPKKQVFDLEDLRNSANAPLIQIGFFPKPETRNHPHRR